MSTNDPGTNHRDTHVLHPYPYQLLPLLYSKVPIGFLKWKKIWDDKGCRYPGNYIYGGSHF